MAVKLNVKIFDLSQVFDRGSGNGQIVDEINGGNQNTIKIQAVISRQIQIAMRRVWSKGRACHPNWGEFFSPFLPARPSKASSPCPLNWLSFPRRGDDEIIDPEIFDPRLSRRSPNLSSSKKAWNCSCHVMPPRLSQFMPPRLSQCEVYTKKAIIRRSGRMQWRILGSCCR